jgi:hypothetical protein
MNSIIEDAGRIGSADPGEPGVVDMASNFIHLYSRMAVIHVVDIEGDEIEQLFAVLL